MFRGFGNFIKKHFGENSGKQELPIDESVMIKIQSFEAQLKTLFSFTMEEDVSPYFSELLSKDFNILFLSSSLLIKISFFKILSFILYFDAI